MRARGRVPTSSTSPFVRTIPYVAQQVVNSIVGSYKAVNADIAQQQSRRRREFIQEQLKQTDSLFADATMALSNYRSQVQVYGSDARVAAEQTGLMTLDVTREQLSADRNTLQSLLDKLQNGAIGAHSEKLDALLASPGIAENTVVSALFGQYVQLRVRRDSLTTGAFSSAKSNPDVMKLDTLISTHAGQPSLRRAQQPRCDRRAPRIPRCAALAQLGRDAEAARRAGGRGAPAAARGDRAQDGRSAARGISARAHLRSGRGRAGRDRRLRHATRCSGRPRRPVPDSHGSHHRTHTRRRRRRARRATQHDRAQARRRRVDAARARARGHSADRERKRQARFAGSRAQASRYEHAPRSLRQRLARHGLRFRIGRRRGVSHAAHESDLLAGDSDAAHDRHHEPVAEGRQDDHGGESRGDIRAARDARADHRLRHAKGATPQHVRAASRARLLPASGQAGDCGAGGAADRRSRISG